MGETDTMTVDVATLPPGEVTVLATLGHTIKATPYVWREPETLPSRQWIYGRWFLRGTLACIVAPGGAGKSTMLAGIALSLTAGKPLLGKAVHQGPMRVWLWNLEDDMDELSRSIQAAALHHDIDPSDLDGRLFVDSGMEGATLCTAKESGNAITLNEEVFEALTAEIQRRKIDVLLIDPFVSSHEVEENANTKIDKIAKAWGRVAKAAGCCIVLVHHTSKAGAGEVTAMSSRGAVALINAARCTLVINRMTEAKARELGIPDGEHRRYISLSDDKHNRAPAEKADWYRLESIDLGNGAENQPGDNIAVAVSWKLPDAFDGLKDGDLYAVQTLVSRGNYRADAQAHEWVGHAVAKALGLQVERDKPRIKRLVKTWIANGVLVIEMRKDPNRSEMKKFVAVGEWAKPSPPPPPHLVEVGGDRWEGGEA